MLIFSATLAQCSDNPMSNGFWKTPLGALRLTIRSLDTSSPFRKRQIWKTIALCSIFLSLYISKIPSSQLIMTRMLVKDFDSKFEASSHQLHCLYYEIDDESIVDVLHICGSMFLLTFCKKSGEASEFRVELLVFTF